MKNLLLFLLLFVAVPLSAQTIITVSDGSCFAPPFQFQGCGLYNSKNQYCADNTSDLRIRWTGSLWEIILLTGGGNQVYYVSSNLNGVFPDEPPTDGWGLYSNPTPPPSAAPCATAGSLGVFSLTLPIELLYFKVKAEQNVHSLQWATASEHNNRGFYVERKNENDSNWQEIGFVAAQNIGDLPDTYVFVDPSPAKGLNYYRLRQLDLDGTFFFSPIVHVRNGKAMALQLAPNPVRDMLRVTLASTAETDSQLRLFNAVGQLVQSQAWSGDLTELSLAALPQGSYFLEVESGGDLVRRRLVVQH